MPNQTLLPHSNASNVKEQFNILLSCWNLDEMIHTTVVSKYQETVSGLCTEQTWECYKYK